MVINFICRASKARKDGQSPIEMSVIINGERSIIALDRKCKSSDFNSKTQKVRGDKEANEYLNAVKAKCYALQTELIKRGEETLIDFIDAYKNGIQDKSATLLKIWDEHNTNYKNKVLSGMVDNTALYKYKVSKTRIEEYLKTLDKTDIKLKDITQTFCEQYECFCLKSLKRSTANKELKILKRILAYAVKQGHLTSSPFDITIHEDKLDYKPLTKGEIESLMKQDIDNHRLICVRDLFIFQCYSGLSYCDMASLTKDDIVDGVILKRRKKTEVKSIIPLLPQAKEILEKYEYKLPIISNQKYNSYLKLLGELCKTRQTLHSHLGRHTYATLLLNNGVDMVTVSKTMGHSNSKITERIYAEMRQQTVVDNVMKAFNP